MKLFPSISSGVSFGLTSGIITSLGLLTGLAAGTDSRVIVIGGLVTIAIADSFSDSLGVHMMEESRAEQDDRSIWKSTIAAFVTKFFFAMSFIVPLLLLPLKIAIVVSVFWGGACLVFLSVIIARSRGEPIAKEVIEHVGIAAVVIVLSTLVGDVINYFLQEI